VNAFLGRCESCYTVYGFIRHEVVACGECSIRFCLPLSWHRFTRSETRGNISMIRYDNIIGQCSTRVLGLYQLLHSLSRFKDLSKVHGFLAPSNHYNSGAAEVSAPIISRHYV